MAARTAGIDTIDPDHNVPPAGFDPQEAGRTIMGHPPGLFLLFFVEMWERFSYYGMRALLVLYLIKSLHPAPDRGLFQDEIINPGRGWTEGDANFLYGWYTGLAYALPIVGGFIADKLLGTHRSMVLGSIVIALGHVVLAVSGFGQWAHDETGMAIFIAGLALIILGTGYFKPTVSVMVGQLYPPGDPRRDGAFSIFYMGINLGAFLCAFVCGTLGQQVGWHWGFGSAAVGMIAGLIMYLVGKPYFLKGIGEPPAGKPNVTMPLMVGSIVLSTVIGYIYFAGGFTWVGDQIRAIQQNPILAWTIVIGGLIAVVAASIWFIAIQKPGDKGPTASILLFMLFNAFFWIAFEQAGSTLNVFAERNTDRTIGSWEMPATWFQSFNAGFIILFAPVFAWLWLWLGKRRMNPSQPMKIALGLILLGLGYVVMVYGARESARTDALGNAILVTPMILTLTYLLHTLGELCLSPTGLSYVTKAAPVRFVSFLMGLWFISSFIANLGGGLIASQVEAIERGELTLPWTKWVSFGGRADYFMLFVISSIGMGLLVMIFTPLLKKMMRNPND